MSFHGPGVEMRFPVPVWATLNFRSLPSKILDLDFEKPKRVANIRKKDESNQIPIRLSNKYKNLYNENVNDSINDISNDLSNNCDNNQPLQHSQHNSKHQSKKHQQNPRKSNSPNKTSKQRKNHITSILGDSMVKDVKGWEISDEQHKVVVKSFSGATTKHMETYVKPSLEQSPDSIVLHCGTNDLKKIKEPQQIARNVINLAVSMKSDSNQVLLSGLVPRKDNFKWQS